MMLRTLLSACTTTGSFPSAALPKRLSLPLLLSKILRSLAIEEDTVGVCDDPAVKSVHFQRS